MTDIETTKTTPAPKAPKAKAKKVAKAKAKAKTPKATEPRKDSKVAQLIAAMKSAKGISTNEAAKRFDWETKSIRGVISGTIRAKLKMDVVTEVDEKRGNVYRIK